MSRKNPVQVITSSDELDIRFDANANGIFADNESVQFGGVSYPIQLINGQTLTNGIFDYNRLGHTSGASLQLSQHGKVVSIEVDASGYVE